MVAAAADGKEPLAWLRIRWPKALESEAVGWLGSARESVARLGLTVAFEWC